MLKKIIIPNVIATRIESVNGVGWQVGNHKYSYGWALTRATDGGLCDFLYAPVGTILEGDIISTRRGQGFQAHENKITRQQSNQWNRMHWVKHFGDDNHFYGDIEFVTYKNPKSKTGKLRTDKVSCISIQHEVNVIVYRKDGKRPTMLIPIELIVEKHPYTYDDEGNIISNRDGI